MKDFRFTPKPELPYFTVPEMLQFEEMRASGEITMFRMSTCVICGADTPKNKKFCSEKCYKEDNDG